jgi:cytoskeletal protein RodZ
VAKHPIGQVLKDRRTQIDWSLDKAERQTNIKKIYISALETGNYEALPGEFYVRAYLKQYATKLDLDIDAILEAYDSHTDVEVDDDYLEDTGNYRFVRPDQRIPERPKTEEEVAEEAAETRRHYAPIVLLSVVAVLILAAVLTIVFLNRQSGNDITLKNYTVATATSTSSETPSSSSTPATTISLAQNGATVTATVNTSKNPVVIDFSLNTGAATTSFSLTNANVQAATLSSANPTAEATLNTSATTATITLGKVGTTTITINGQPLTLTGTMASAYLIVLQMNYTGNTPTTTETSSTTP